MATSPYVTTRNNSIASSTVGEDTTRLLDVPPELPPKPPGEADFGKAQNPMYDAVPSMDATRVPQPIYLEMPDGNGRSGPVSERTQITNGHAANIVIFGETGVGKSSIINLIADQKLARTSNDTHGCTFHHERHPVILGDISCALWDTTGLDEGSEGTVPAKLAENNLKELLRGLTHSGGIHLVIYCIRGSRLTKALKRNYDLFYVTVCRKKVPVALVVTGLEHQQGDMETWWSQNVGALRRNGMQFDAHACVTTVNVEDRVLQERRSESRALLCELVVKYAGLPGWKTDASFISQILPLFNSVFRGTSSIGNLGIYRAVWKVAVCGSSFGFLPGTTAVWDKTTGRLGNRRYKFLRVDKDALHGATLQDFGSVSVGMLVFYMSPLVDNRILPMDVDALKRFYDIAGGRSCPVVVVLQGCDDEQVASARFEINARYSDIQAHYVTISGTNDVGGKLDEMIESLCMEQVEMKAPKFFKKIFSQ